MSKPIIWETDFVRAFEKYRAAVSYKPYEDGASMEVREVFGSVLRRMSAGRPAQRDELPDHLFVNEERTKLPKTGLPDFFYARSLRIISEEVRTLLDAFETGQTQFHEIRILGRDRKTWLDGCWYILNWVADQDCFVPEKSHEQRVGRIGDTSNFWAIEEPRPDQRDQWIAVKSAEYPLDLWADPRLKTALFFSDRLKRAIEASKFKKSIGFHPCIVV